jgi:hypothetical protein
MCIKRWILVAVVFGSLVMAGAARAQDRFTHPVGGSVYPAPVVVTSVPQPGPVFPYSYWAAWPQPARAYVAYGANDIFPYGGRPYGHAYDRFSWATLAGSGDLARYYYPPVR